MLKQKYNSSITFGQLCSVLLLSVYSLLFLAVNSSASEPISQPLIQTNRQTAISLTGSPPKNEDIFDPKIIEPLLKQQFKVIAPDSSSSNPYPALALRSNKARILDSIDSQYEVLDVKPFDDKGFFRQQKILLITVSYVFLEARIKLSNRSIGMFAFDGKKLTYLNGPNSIANIDSILKLENRSLSEADPQMLAKFFAMTILRQDNDRINVVQSPDDILKLDKPNAAKMNEMIKKKHMGRLYATTVDKIELEKCKPFFIKPQLSYEAKTGWQCRFIGLRGFMHTIRVPFALIGYTVSISPSYDIKVADNILSSKIII